VLNRKLSIQFRNANSFEAIWSHELVQIKWNQFHIYNYLPHQRWWEVMYSPASVCM